MWERGKGTERGGGAWLEDNADNDIQYGQCGGSYYSGSTVCASGLTCTYDNAEYSYVRLPPSLFVLLSYADLLSVLLVRMIWWEFH
jgi:hypothetical protein